MQYVTRFLARTGLLGGILLGLGESVLAADHDPIIKNGRMNPKALLRAGGVIGYVTIALSVAMVALMIEQLLSLRREVLVPRSQAEELHKLISAGQIQQAEQLCRQRPTFLSYMILAGLQEASFGYDAMEKAMEDAALEQSARLARKIEYLSVIGGVSPMLGLLGTVWGMIQAFAEFTVKANPTPAEFAPAISEALVTTLFGLCVAIPALSAYAWFRNRIDELVAETALVAEQVIVPLRRSLRDRRRPETAPAPAPGPRPKGTP
jgi:biopolymer transport protein ExbB